MAEVPQPQEATQNLAQEGSKEQAADTKPSLASAINTQAQRENQTAAYQQLAEKHETKDQQALALVREKNTDLLGTPTETSQQTHSETHPSLADLKTKSLAPGDGKEYTPKEAFYLENGWKAYVKEYGSEGYSLEEIARNEKLDAGDIKNAIAEGLTDPNALRFYGQLALDQDKAYFSKWAAEHPDEAWIQERANLLTKSAEEEYTPLINGDEKDLSRYSIRQARNALETYNNKQLDMSDDEREQYNANTLNWLTLSEKALAQKPNELAEKDTPAPTETAPQLTEEQQSTLDYLQANPKLIDLLGNLHGQDSKDLQETVTLLKKDPEQGSTTLDLLRSLIDAIKTTLQPPASSQL